MKICFGFAALLCSFVVNPAIAGDQRKVELIGSNSNIEKGHREVFDVVLPAGTVAIELMYDCHTQSMTNYSWNGVSFVLMNAAGEKIRSVGDHFKSESTWGPVYGVIHSRKMSFSKPPKPGKYKLRVSVYGGDYMNFVASFTATAVLSEK